MRERANKKDVKRVLWLEDIKKEEFNQDPFSEDEYRLVRTMEEMLDTIDHDEMFNYDLVILDINMEEGVCSGAEKIVSRLKAGGLYFSEEEDINELIRSRGGYFIFLYLLKKGFPSDRIAFLTGNPNVLSSISHLGKASETVDADKVYDLLTDTGFIDKSRDPDFIIDDWRTDNAAALEEKLPLSFINMQLSDLSDDILEKSEKGPVDDAEMRAFVIERFRELFQNNRESNRLNEESGAQDILTQHIEKFHFANLEMIQYFAKMGKEVEAGHNWDDFKNWYSQRRDNFRVLRWLTLSLCDLLLGLFESRDSVNVFGFVDCPVKRLNLDSAKIAIGQLQRIFSDARRSDDNSVYLQALTAASNPFDETDTKSVTSMLAKQIRNYCAHNYFFKNGGITEQEYLFCLGVLATAYCPKASADSQRIDTLKKWHKRVKKEMIRLEGRSFGSAVLTGDFEEKVQAFLTNQNYGDKMPSYLKQAVNMTEAERRANNRGKSRKTLEWKQLQYLGYVDLSMETAPPPHYYINTLYCRLYLSEKQGGLDCLYRVVYHEYLYKYAVYRLVTTNFPPQIKTIDV